MYALERYYQELYDYSQYSNCEGYDLDVQLTRNRLEKIITVGYMTKDDVNFVKSLLPDIESDTMRADIQDYIESITDF